MRLLPARARVAKPWKNGGGITWDVDVAPQGAGLEDFDWRVSVAEVASEGPFSTFLGIDRTLTLARGAGMTLLAGGVAQTPSLTTHALTTASDPLAFPGDVPVVSRLTDGPILDLNVMTRRGRFAHRVRRLDPPPATLRGDAAVTLLACLDGAASLTCGEETARLGPLDLADISGETVALAAEPGARLLRIEIEPV